jgi:hypothetical protein
LSGLRRGTLKSLPRSFRAREALRLGREVVRRTYRDSSATARLRRGEGTFDVQSSIFCGVREPVPQPLCGYYATAVTRLFALCEIEGWARTSQCRGAGDTGCRLAVSIGVAPDSSPKHDRNC